MAFKSKSDVAAEEAAKQLARAEAISARNAEAGIEEEPFETPESAAKALTVAGMPDELRKQALTKEQRQEIGSFADALKYAEQAAVSLGLPGVAKATDVFGDGYKLTEKSELVGKRMVVVDWHFSDGDFGPAGFVSVNAVLADDTRVVFNDGSTGVRDQLTDFTLKLKSTLNIARQPIVCEDGLRVSEYDYEDAKGNVSRAKTYYLA